MHILVWYQVEKLFYYQTNGKINKNLFSLYQITICARTLALQHLGLFFSPVKSQGINGALLGANNAMRNYSS